MYKVKKDDLIYELKCEIQLSAFLNSGYVLITEEEKPKRGKKE